ncbi:MAG: cytochrome-c oxidase, cbb3-type subunit I [Myxococcota bacterium]
MQTQTIVYNDKIARQFLWASVFWGIVGMLVGTIVALQLAYWPANVTSWLSFGRLRPLHTNAVIFAFVGNMIFAGVYYSTQRLLKTRIASDKLSSFNFWGWQGIIVAAAVTLPLGITQSKEYAELEWPIDVAIAVVWLAFAVNFFWTLKKRNEKHLYVALWFYIATIAAITVLHVVNGLAVPVSWTKSYSVFGGVQDALVQWWYGHNAVAFFLTTPILGIMYYFVPKAAERPVYSYRLSIVHFWSLVFLYIWAGPHHLLNTALPDWAQTLGMIFSVMLLAPSWGGMINGLLTLRGAWDKLRRDPVLKFFAAGITFYGMATFEGPLLSIKGVSALSHYTDWIIAHVHAGALGWNGFMAAGVFYWMVPRLFGTKLHSPGAANFHFYFGTFGILLYVVSMWVSGVTQGLMWQAENDAGGLMYPNFLETVLALQPMYWTRLVGGTMYLLGFILMTWNLVKTARSGKAVDGEAQVAIEAQEPAGERPPWKDVVLGKPVIVSVVGFGLVASIAFINELASTFIIVLAICGVGIAALAMYLGRDPSKETWHHIVEGRGAIFTTLIVGAVLVGGIAEIVPMVVTAPERARASKHAPYAPLELEGRDVFIQEGCYVCHSQMIRPFTWETARFGEPSTEDESVWDHPFQWGSKRTGPDLARIGGKYSDAWHYRHLMDPREISPGSNMPNYDFLAETSVDYDDTPDKLRAMRNVGVPYEPEQIATASEDARHHARSIAEELKSDGDIDVPPESQMVAIIGYLQRLGSQEATQPERPVDDAKAAPVARARVNEDAQEVQR